jgi:hypothetical protein
MEMCPATNAYQRDYKSASSQQCNYNKHAIFCDIKLPSDQDEIVTILKSFLGMPF